jgi:multidrug efflux system membrane fusion protein
VDGLRVVKSGLSSDDKVIIGGLQQIYFPGAPIKAKTATMESLIAESDKPAAAGIK